MLSFLGESKPSTNSTSTSTTSTSTSPSTSTSLVVSPPASSSIFSAPYSALSSVAKTASDSVSSAAKTASANVSGAVSSAAKSASDSVSSVAKTASANVSGAVSSAAKTASDSVSKSVSSVVSLDDAVSSASKSASESVSGSSWFDMWTILRYFGIILILSFLGFNLFGYLGKVTETVKETLKPFLLLLGFGAAETVKATVNLGAKGADVAAETVTSGVNLLEKGISKKNGAKINKIDNKSKIDMNLLNKAVKNQDNNDEPEPDEAGSRTQASKAKIKSGFCYIGEDRGFRRCIKVGEGDKCMSGDIFPTDDICVNPSLRE